MPTFQDNYEFGLGCVEFDILVRKYKWKYSFGNWTYRYETQCQYGLERQNGVYFLERGKRGRT